MVKDIRPELKEVYFLDAEVSHNKDGSYKNELPRGKPRSIGAKIIGVAHDAAFYIPLPCLGSEYIFVLPFRCPFCPRW